MNLNEQLANYFNIKRNKVLYLKLNNKLFSMKNFAKTSSFHLKSNKIFNL